MPDLLLAVKQAVDRNPSRLRFVLSRSANLLLMRRVSESLAGRRRQCCPKTSLTRLSDPLIAQLLEDVLGAAEERTAPAACSCPKCAS
ncbi:MAG: hypothetical protein U9R15_06710 [Chloroflexota bacterium]|nr:hypothetical protein [Chloroflexota bacterium]